MVDTDGWEICENCKTYTYAEFGFKGNMTWAAVMNNCKCGKNLGINEYRKSISNDFIDVTTEEDLKNGKDWNENWSERVIKWKEKN